MKFPHKVEVKQLKSSRYPDGCRPTDWDQRTPGMDRVIGADGAEYPLASDGGQSPPKSGWIIMLRGGDNQDGYLWTLYGLAL